VSTPAAVLVSDTHLSPRAPDAERNWEAVLRHVDAVRPDVVLHTGDLSLDGLFDADELAYAKTHLDRLSVPWMAIPGNHDVGDNIHAADPSEEITSERVANWVDRIGRDWWAADLGGWRLVALDAQLFGSGLPAEAEQWAFVESEMGSPEARRPRVLLTHKPVEASAQEMATATRHRFVPDPERGRLCDLMRAAGVSLVVSGHVHQERQLDFEGVAHVWAATTWAVLPDELQLTIGHKRCGLVHLYLPEEGAPRAEHVEPDGMAQLVIGVNTESLYDH
jgi:3',5'-cyclic AMP phosphodiesterase CpdA